MSEFLEWDFDNPKHRQRRRRQPLPLEGEVLGPELEIEPKSRVRVEVVHRYQPRRQHDAIPPWAIAILIIGFLCWVSPLGTVIALVIIPIFLAMHPTVAIALGVFVALVIVVALRERWYGRAF
jgi:hypothetical protein